MSISIYNIEEFVSNDLLVRAVGCLDSGVLSELEEQSTRDYTAIVSGSSTYSVSVVLDNDLNVFTHQCNCPYTASAICKHKVALILLIRNRLQNDEAIPKGNLSMISDKLGSCNKELLYQLLMNLSKRDKRIRDVIMKELDIKTNS